MLISTLKTCCLAILAVSSMQSLVDIARKEADRRKQLEEQGIEGRVIEGNPVPSDSNISVWTDPPPAPKRESKRTDSTKGKTSVRSFRTKLQKLDRNIRESKDRLESKRARLRAGQWAVQKTGRSSGRGKKEDSQAQLQAEIEDLEIKLKQLRRERAEVYEEGKKAGFLPGELDGHGLSP